MSSETLIHKNSDENFTPMLPRSPMWTVTLKRDFTEDDFDDLEKGVLFGRYQQGRVSVKCEREDVESEAAKAVAEINNKGGWEIQEIRDYWADRDRCLAETCAWIMRH